MIRQRPAAADCCSCSSSRWFGTVSLLLLLLSTKQVLSNDFEPYQLNGGLVSGVAGKDYCIIATDTRMIHGYEILTREHLSSRLWSATTHNSNHHHHQDASSSSSWLTNDGSIRLPPTGQDKETTFQNRVPTMTLVASAGCAADCDALKRNVRLDVRAYHHHQDTSCTRRMQRCLLRPHQVAQMLAHTLYGRRGFPFYAFCIVAGLDSIANTNGGQGKVYVYDAIGSYEQVAVASAGVGRELLQPILDRLFRSREKQPQLVGSSNPPPPPGVIPKVAPTTVDCSVEDSIDHLKRAYQAVTEREISVGDSMVMTILQHNREDPQQPNVSCRVIRVPLRND